MLDTNFNLFGSLIPAINLGSNNQSPVLDIVGGDADYAKVTEGSVKISAVAGRTTVRITGAKGWKITGDETIG